MKQRVVITGIGVCAPNGLGKANFLEALQKGRSGIRFQEELARLNFRCQVAGVPALDQETLDGCFTTLELKRLKARGVLFGALAAIEAWEDAQLPLPNKDSAPHWQIGTVFGTGMSGVQTLREAIYKTDEGKVKKLGGSVVEQTMPSGISAYLSGRFGLGNWVTSNSSACSTGSEALILAAEHVAQGRAEIMIAGGCDADGPYVWGGFDSMRVLNARSNDRPSEASRPLSAEASGFVPGSGGGALILESLASAKKRGAAIYAEWKGGALNAGGQRGSGSMTAPNNEGVQRCIKSALQDAALDASSIDLVAGHLTSTMGDVLEVKNWALALGRSSAEFPQINALKSMTGHCLSAAGAIEAVAAVLQLKHQFVHASLNAQPLHPEIADILKPECIPAKARELPLETIAKSSFGFGDVNACFILNRYHD